MIVVYIYINSEGQNAEDQTDAFEQVGDLTEIEKSLGEIHGEGDSLVLIDSFSIENRLPRMYFFRL